MNQTALDANLAQIDRAIAHAKNAKLPLDVEAAALNLLKVVRRVFVRTGGEFGCMDAEVFLYDLLNGIGKP